MSSKYDYSEPRRVVPFTTDEPMKEAKKKPSSQTGKILLVCPDCEGKLERVMYSMVLVCKNNNCRKFCHEPRN
jgi:hypothetical protein